MKTVAQWFKLHPSKLCAGQIGLEIEVEGVGLPRPARFWKVDADASLRGESCEYVLKKPLSLPQAKLAIDHLGECYTEASTVVHESVRAGVHVHINCQDLNIVQLYTFMTLYLALEPLLVHYCGSTREGNLFCLRSQDADYLLWALTHAAQSKDFLSLDDENLRYASMNVMALASYGSLEFRAMRGTADLEAIWIWVKMLHILKLKAQAYDSPADIIFDMSGRGAEEFARHVLGDDLYPHVYVGKASTRKLVMEGIRSAQDVAYCCDWEEFKNMKASVNPFLMAKLG